MEALYTLLSLAAAIVMIAVVIGLIRPRLFAKLLKKKATRKHIAIYGLLLIFGLGILITITEPQSVKQARIDKENAAKIAKQEEQNRIEQERLAQEAAESKQAEENKQTEAQSKEPEPDPRYYWYEVTQVVDGDTVKARVDGKVESIRIIGIDSPESTSSTECFGAESSAKAKEFLGGKWIQLEKDDSQGDRDKYGRLLRYVWFDEGTDFGRRMIEEGYAHEYTYSKPYNKQAQYKETEQAAKNAHMGLWSPDTCNGQAQKPTPTKAQTNTNTTTPAPAPTPAPSTSTNSNCDPNYTPCIKYVPGNTLNCDDIGIMVRVIGDDHNKFDANHDGYGCESYR